jgi:nickel-dependent lactate racemase
MQHDGSGTTKSTMQRYREHTATRPRAIGGKDGCGWVIPQQQEQDTTQPEDHMGTSCGSHWREKNACWTNACSGPKAATQRIKGGGIIARWSGKHDDCGDRVYQHKECQNTQEEQHENAVRWKHSNQGI